jgi:hypothetical protein
MSRAALAVWLNFVTLGGIAGGAAPAITAVENNYSYLIPGQPNYGIAPGSLFIVKGTGLAAAGTVPQLWDVSKTPLPLSSPGANGTSITVVVGGTTVQPGIYYISETQVAAVLPSNTPVGTGTITVTYNNQTSAAASILVVTSAMGFDTLYDGRFDHLHGFGQLGRGGGAVGLGTGSGHLQ